jgi:UDP-N-acetylglucosamine 2-epimerase (non-hydrolysing)
MHAAMVFTDSGGLQEETTVLGVPCLTLRANTERPITCEVGTNRVVGNRPDDILRHAREVLNGGVAPRQIPERWDGKAADRIVQILAEIDRAGAPAGDGREDRTLAVGP